MVEPKPMISEFDEALDEPRRTGNHHVAVAAIFSYQVFGRRQLGDELVRLMRSAP